MAGLNHMSASPLGPPPPPPLGHHLGQPPFGPGSGPPGVPNGAPNGAHPPYPLLPGGPFCPPLGLGPPPPLPPGFPLGLPPGPHVQPRRKNATRETTQLLKTWLNAHKTNPYPTKQEKIFLAVWASMTMTQVSTWFANARRRLKKENKMTWSPRNRCDDDDDDDDNDDDDDHDDDMSSNGQGGGRSNSTGPGGNHEDLNEFGSPQQMAGLHQQNHHQQQQQQPHSDHHLSNTSHHQQQLPPHTQPQHNQALHGPYSGLNGLNVADQATRQQQQQLFEQRHLSDLVRLSQQAANGAHQLANKQHPHDPQQQQIHHNQHQHAVLAAAMAAAQQHHQQQQQNQKHLNEIHHQNQIRTTPPNANARLPPPIGQSPIQQQALPPQLSNLNLNMNLKQQEHQLQQQIQQHLQQQLQQQFKQQQQPNPNQSSNAAQQQALQQLASEQFSSSAAAAHLFQSSLHPGHPLYHMMAAHHAAAAAAIHAQAQQQQQHQQRHASDNLNLNLNNLNELHRNHNSQNRVLSSKEDEDVDVVERDDHDIVGDRAFNSETENRGADDDDDEKPQRPGSAERVNTATEDAENDSDELRASRVNKRKRSAVKLEQSIVKREESGLDLSDDSDATDAGELSDNNNGPADEDRGALQHKSKRSRKSGGGKQLDQSGKRPSNTNQPAKPKRPSQDQKSQSRTSSSNNNNNNNNSLTHSHQTQSIPKTPSKAADQSNQNDPFLWRPFA